MPQPHESLQVSEARWIEAQRFERDVWADNNRRNGLLKLGRKLIRAALHPRDLARIARFGDWYCGDDWNFWWLDAFDGYAALPRSLDRGLEVGCGPYTNIRLIARLVRLREITCVDPLMDEYLTYRWTWLAEEARRGRVRTESAPAESLPFDAGAFDLVVCINVLDHVRDAPRCLDEMHRVLAPGGLFVIGQDLTDADDARIDRVRNDVGHPIKIDGATLDGALMDRYEPVLTRRLTREQGRGPQFHCGTSLFIGRRR